MPLQCAQDSDAFPGEPCEGAAAERAGGSALQAASASGAARRVTGHGTAAH